MGWARGRNQSKGVLYQLLWTKNDRPERLSKRGGQSLSIEPNGAAELLLVSLMSLRVHYAGRIIIRATPQCMEVAEHIASDIRIDAEVLTASIDRSIPNPCYMGKLDGMLASPLDRTVALDIDTLVCRCSLDDLLGQDGLISCEHCRINDSTPMARGVRYAFKQYGKVSEPFGALASDAIRNDVRLTNTGVMAYPRGNDVLWFAHAVAVATKNHPKLTTEMAIQLGLSLHQESTQWMPDTWNTVLRYVCDVSNSQIVHGHGRRWCRTDVGKELWRPWFRKAFQENWGSIALWGDDSVLTCEE